MPIKWTPEMDQTLLLKILETSNVNADVRAISEVWPSDRCDGQGKPPTARAITERLVKIRSLSKAGGAGHFSVSSAKTGTPRKAAPTTPRGKAKKVLAATAAKSSDSSISLSNNTTANSQSSDDGYMPGTPMSISTPASRGGKRKLESPATRVKCEESAEDEQDFGMVFCTPSKKAKSARATSFDRAFDEEFPELSEDGGDAA